MKTFHTVLSALNEISVVPGKKDKEALVKKHLESTPDFETVIVLMLNPFKRFYIKNFIESTSSPSTWGTTEAYEIFDNLANRTLSGDAARFACGRLVHAGFPADLMIRILNKDPKAGFGESTVNKAKKGLLPDFPYMRCLSADWKVEDEHGNCHKICDIVDNHNKINIKCRNLNTNTDEYKPIIDVFNLLQNLDISQSATLSNRGCTNKPVGHHYIIL
jgi:hypothetical protein